MVSLLSSPSSRSARGTAGSPEMAWLLAWTLEGVRAEGAGRTPFLHWNQIALCEILTVRDIVGEDAFTRYIFKDADGKLLMTVATIFTSREDRQRLGQAVRDAFAWN